MTVYTKINVSEVTEIMSRFGIGDILSHVVLSGGSQNSNYQVSAVEGDFVLSICEQSSPEEMHQLALLLEHLKVHNFSTSVVVQTLDGHSLSDWNGKPVMVKRFLHGQVVDDIPNHVASHIGVQLGRLHKVPAPDFIPDMMSYGIEYFHEVEMYASGSVYHHWLMAKKIYLQPFLTDSLPKSLIHSDVFSSNVIIDESEEFVTIMDFEEAAFYFRIFDVGMTIIGICREGVGINFAKTKSLIQGYSTEIQMTEEEIKSLQAFVVYAATAMSFWRHKNFNYTVPTPSLFDHYQELKFIADTVQSIDASTFLTRVTS